MQDISFLGLLFLTPRQNSLSRDEFRFMPRTTRSYRGLNQCRQPGSATPSSGHFTGCRNQHSSPLREPGPFMSEAGFLVAVHDCRHALLKALNELDLKEATTSDGN